ncbi:uncharacterized protein PHALS_12317 [Plasmopara halstedii]|uniref:Uncharacterized protein n=1 Tax=Plasmopara halstedii TaxID=4781 RepID=A0A0P1AL39_PLAHL|nr:uncharacterized protein PHALS_12317 [Plasmopara halstedii]CEG42010.1 hypothetical protein PHALS_12317 [Plasmopara halstedii]|eukprot:XP_024578379.1 hypothetical protein PHALS_12317 [Plasmopara halstedii]
MTDEKNRHLVSVIKGNKALSSSRSSHHEEKTKDVKATEFSNTSSCRGVEGGNSRSPHLLTRKKRSGQSGHPIH